MAPAPALADLIATVEADAGSTEPLVRLAAASATAAELAETGITEQWVAQQVGARTPPGHAGPAEPPFTPLAAQVFGGALSEALSMGHNYIGTEHILLALFGQPEGQAAQILTDAGTTHAAC